MSDDLGHAKGPEGWGDGTESPESMVAYEQDWYEQAASDSPIMYRSRPANDLLPSILKKWEDAQLAKHFHAGSRDLLTLEEVVFGRQFDWLPQDIGSCVVSNTFRPWVQRAISQIAGRGDAEEYLGKMEFGGASIAFYAPQSYGMARKRANMKGSDGLYCEPMAESLMKDGVLGCNVPKLGELLKQIGADGEKMLPEPIGRPALYRAFGNWQYIDDLRQYCDYRVLSSVKIDSVDGLLEASKQCKPAFMCSPIAIKRSGTNRDGVQTHVRNTSDRWMHNMGWSGHFYDSAGSLYFRLNNKSWGPSAVYNVPAEEVDKWFRAKLPTVMTIEEIDLPDSPPLLIL